MRIVCIGGGAAGLYFALLMKKQHPSYQVTVVERNRPDDTFGWGVVFSDKTLDHLHAADAETAEAIFTAFNHWKDIEVVFKEQKIRCTGHGFCGIGRKRMLNILQNRCAQLGVKLIFESAVTDDTQFDCDLIVAADGINSVIRNKYADVFQPEADIRTCKFVWLGTSKLFDALTFIFEETPWGWFQSNSYRFDDSTSTFVVEASDTTWAKAGIDRMDKDESIDLCARIFAKHLGGHSLISNSVHLRGSAQWSNFPQITCKNWVHHNGKAPVVLIGDAAHTAHYSVGSGTKLALEDAIELARCINLYRDDLNAALENYETMRRTEASRIQTAASHSATWFESVDDNAHWEPEQFAYSLLTRSKTVTHEKLKLRDPQYIEQYEKWCAQQKVGGSK